MVKRQILLETNLKSYGKISNAGGKILEIYGLIWEIKSIIHGDNYSN